MKESRESAATQNSKLKTQSLIEVAAGLVFRGGQLLITQRLKGSHLAGLWEFPGGKREPSENYEACLRRELREELGIEVEVKDLLESIRHDYPEKSVYLKFFRCTLLQNEPAPLNCADIAWVTPDKLTQYAFPAADARLLARLQNDPSLWL